MNARRRVLVASVLGLVLERVLAYTLVTTDASGHLLSAGVHSAIGIVVALVVFLALRIVLVLAAPALVVLLVLEFVRIGSTIATRGARAKSSESE